MLETTPTPSPIVRVLNEHVTRYHRWCTPSILPDQERVEDFYASDVSISAGFFGTLVDHTGIFAEAEAFAAAAQGADRTMFSVHGSSGSNWIVLRLGGEALGLLEDPGVVDERAEEARGDRHVGGVEVLDPLLVGEDRRRAPPVVTADVLVEDADDRRRRGASCRHDART